MTTLTERLAALAESLVGCEWEHPITAVADVREAIAVLERLPVTADGVSITPGMSVFDAFCGHALPVSGYNTIGGKLSCLYSEGGGFDAICSGYYSTREAAERAAQQGKD